MFEEVIGQEDAETRASDEQEDTRDPVAAIESQEGSEHHEEMDGIGREKVAGSGEGDLPTQVPVALDGAQIGGAKPVDVRVEHVIRVGEEVRRQQKTSKHPQALDETQLVDEVEESLGGVACHQTARHQVREQRLETDVQKADCCQHLVDLVVALVDPEVLEKLQ